jgi:hypothetical protein
VLSQGHTKLDSVEKVHPEARGQQLSGLPLCSKVYTCSQERFGRQLDLGGYSVVTQHCIVSLEKVPASEELWQSWGHLLPQRSFAEDFSLGPVSAS